MSTIYDVRCPFCAKRMHYTTQQKDVSKEFYNCIYCGKRFRTDTNIKKRRVGKDKYVYQRDEKKVYVYLYPLKDTLAKELSILQSLQKNDIIAPRVITYGEKEGRYYMIVEDIGMKPIRKKKIDDYKRLSSELYKTIKRLHQIQFGDGHLLHMDLSQKNICYDGNNVGLLDFEKARSGESLLEFTDIFIKSIYENKINKARKESNQKSYLYTYLWDKYKQENRIEKEKILKYLNHDAIYQSMGGHFKKGSKFYEYCRKKIGELQE